MHFKFTMKSLIWVSIILGLLLDLHFFQHFRHGNWCSSRIVNIEIFLRSLSLCIVYLSVLFLVPLSTSNTIHFTEDSIEIAFIPSKLCSYSNLGKKALDAVMFIHLCFNPHLSRALSTDKNQMRWKKGEQGGGEYWFILSIPLIYKPCKRYMHCIPQSICPRLQTASFTLSRAFFLSRGVNVDRIE